MTNDVVFEIHEDLPREGPGRAALGPLFARLGREDLDPTEDRSR